MQDTVFRDAKELLKEKESETTWFKVFGVFEKLLNSTNTKEKAMDALNHTSELLIRSMQSDRSRLNGVALDFLKKCGELVQKEYNLSLFLHTLVKLTGRSNKVFVSRAMDALAVLCKHVDLKTLQKNITEFIESPNKNVRFAVFKVIELRVSEFPDALRPFVEKGLRDPAQEVRSLCKTIVIPSANIPVEIPEIKKTVVASLTPRKNFKVDSECVQIKKLEKEVMKIAKEQIVRKPINAEFFEKLRLLKNEKKFTVEKSVDELTPKKLDLYLNKYRSMSSSEGLSKSIGEKCNENAPSVSANQQTHEKGLPAIVSLVTLQAPLCITSSPIVAEEPKTAISNQDVSSTACAEAQFDMPDDDLLSFTHETLYFRKEMDSSGQKDPSIIHELIPDSDKDLNLLGVLGSDRNDELNVILNEYEDSLIIKNEDDTGILCEEAPEISELSRSFANICIEPNREAFASSFIAQENGVEAAYKCVPNECTVCDDEKMDVVDECINAYQDVCKRVEEDVVEAKFHTSEHTNERIEDAQIPIEHPLSDVKSSASEQRLLELKIDEGTENPFTPEIESLPDMQVSLLGPQEQYVVDSEQLPANNEQLCAKNDTNPADRECNAILSTYESSNTPLRVEFPSLGFISNQSKLPKQALRDGVVMDHGLDFDMYSDLNVLRDVVNLDENLVSFIEKTPGLPDCVGNSICNDITLCIQNPNETMVIESMQHRDISNVFESEKKSSCVELFNEVIFCSDEESVTKRDSFLKERPSFNLKRDSLIGKNNDKRSASL